MTYGQIPSDVVRHLHEAGDGDQRDGWTRIVDQYNGTSAGQKNFTLVLQNERGEYWGVGYSQGLGGSRGEPGEYYPWLTSTTTRVFRVVRQIPPWSWGRAGLNYEYHYMPGEGDDLVRLSSPESGHRRSGVLGWARSWLRSLGKDGR